MPFSLTPPTLCRGAVPLPPELLAEVSRKRGERIDRRQVLRDQDDQDHQHRHCRQHLSPQVQVVAGPAHHVVIQRLPVEDNVPNQPGDKQDSKDVVQVDPLKWTPWAGPRGRWS